jgi:hypothetical protein
VVKSENKTDYTVTSVVPAEESNSKKCVRKKITFYGNLKIILMAIDSEDKW